MAEQRNNRFSAKETFQMSQALLACHAEGVAAKWSIKKLRMELSHRTGLDCTPTNLRRLFEITGIDGTPFGRQSMSQINRDGPIKALKDRLKELESNQNADLSARADLEIAVRKMDDQLAFVQGELARLKTELGAW